VLEQIATPSAVGAMMVLAGLGSLVFVGGMMRGGLDGLDHRTLPPATLTLIIGVVGFALFFPWHLRLWSCRILLRAIHDLEERVQKGPEHVA
jgi:hypothetical protein